MQVDEVTVGVGDHRQAPRARAHAQLGDAVGFGSRARAERPFFGIYLPAHPDNRQSAQRSLIGPEDKFTTGGMVELDTGNARYLIRFTQTLEQQAGWSWAHVQRGAQAVRSSRFRAACVSRPDKPRCYR